MALTGLDHLIVMGEDLQSLIDQYRALGFTVIPGGRHPWGTHNALICLADGSYIELLAFWGHPPEGHRHIAHVEQGGGLVEFMLASDNIDADITAAGSNGIPYEPAQAGARTRPDGAEVAWKNGLAQWAPGMPHLIEDLTDRLLRVPDGPARQHDNGITGITRLVLGVADLPTSSGRYCALLEQRPANQDDNRAVFEIGAQQLELLRASAADSPLARQVESLGDSPFEVHVAGPDTRSIDPQQAGGVRIHIAAG